MTIGVGGSSAEAELAALADMTGGMAPISVDEIKGRLARAQNLMQTVEIDVLYIHAGTNLLYFAGVDWHPSERLVGAILPAQGGLQYILPAFEAGRIYWWPPSQGIVTMYLLWAFSSSALIFVYFLGSFLKSEKPEA